MVVVMVAIFFASRLGTQKSGGLGLPVVKWIFVGEPRLLGSETVQQLLVEKS